MIKRILEGLLIVLVVIAARASGAQSVRLRVETKECIQGILLHPVGVSVTVFDAAKVPKVLQAAASYELSAERANEDGPEKMESAYATLKAQVRSTPALARLKNLSKPVVEFNLPPVRKIIIFSFGMTESESMYAKRELDIAPGGPNDAVLNFSTDEECTNAK